MIYIFQSQTVIDVRRVKQFKVSETELVSFNLDYNNDFKFAIWSRSVIQKYT